MTRAAHRPVCAAVGTRDGVEFLCTLGIGHLGDHVAERVRDRYRLHVWPQGGEPAEVDTRTCADPPDRQPVEPLADTLADLATDREDREPPPPVPIWRGLQQELGSLKEILGHGAQPAAPPPTSTVEIMAALTAIEAEGIKLALLTLGPKAPPTEILARGELFARYLRRRLRLPEME